MKKPRTHYTAFAVVLQDGTQYSIYSTLALARKCQRHNYRSTIQRVRVPVEQSVENYYG